MSDAIPVDRPIGIAPGFRLQWEQAQDAHVLLFPEGMIKLSESASQILSRCDDNSTLEDIVASLEQAFPGADLKDDVVEFLQVAYQKGWIALR